MHLLNDILLVVGVLLILEGVPYSGFPGAFKRCAERLSKLETNRLRVVGWGMMLIGLLVLFIRKWLFL